MRQTGRPSGIPVSRAFDIRPGIANDELRAAVEAINRVHGDGFLPSIPISLAGDVVDHRAHGADAMVSFEEDDRGRFIPVYNVVRSGAPHRRFVVLHEIGHALDAIGLPGAGFASASWAGLEDWRKTVGRSRAHRTLERQKVVDPDRVERLLRPEELWARAYAQFVTARSGDPDLLASLGALRRSDGGAVYYPRQWDEDDFSEIERAIADAFRGVGWIA